MKTTFLNRIAVFAAAMLISAASFAQTTITGTVIDAANDELVIGASVLV